jgi:hypothetical protein
MRQQAPPALLVGWPGGWGWGQYALSVRQPLLFAISPGRFVSVNEIKVLFAFIIATYDIKFEEGKGVPREFCIAGLRFPGNATVMFRTRQK